MELTDSFLDIITLGIALWGAVLSTILAIKNFQKDKRRISVSCRLLEQTLSQDGTLQNQIVGIIAVNIGYRDVKLVNAGLITKSKKYFVANTHQVLPVILGDGASVTIRIKLDDAAARLRDISPLETFVSGYVKDIEGVFYKTSKLPDIMVNRKMAKKSWRIRK